jgi:hypothetical protein
MRWVLVILFVLAVMLAGCSSPRVAEPLTQTLGKDDPDTQLEFWHRLGERPMTSNDDAFHGLLLYLDGKDANQDYAGRVAELKRRKIIPAGFDRPADEALQRGTLAMAILKVTNVRGGVMATALGPTPRYATRELVYVGLYPPSSPNQTFSGSEYVGIIGRLEDYQRGNPADKPAASLPGEAPTKIEE